MTGLTLRSACSTLAAIGILLLTVVPVLPARAQLADPSQDAARLSLEVLRLDGVVTASADLRLRVRIRNGGLRDRGDVRLLATVHREAIGRFRLQQAVEQGEVGNIVHPVVTDVDDIPARGSRTVELTQSLDDLGLARPGQEGVYPLRVQVLADGDVLDEVVTSLVVVPTRVGTPLFVGLLLPVALPPARDAEGVVTDGAVLDALGDGGRLPRTLQALRDAPRLTPTLAVDGHTLRDLEDLGDGFAVRSEGTVVVQPVDSAAATRARNLLGELGTITQRSRTSTVALPYASADLVSLVRHGLEGEAARQITDGADVVARLPGVDADTRVLWPPDAIDAAALEVARQTGAETIVLPEGALALGPPGDRSPSPLRRLRSEGRVLDVLVPDPYLEPVLGRGSPDGPALAAQQILAEVASVYFELPGTPQRGLLLAPPTGTAIPGTVVEALAPRLAAAPFARTVPVADLPDLVAPEARPASLAYPSSARARELPLTYATMLATARRSLGSLDGVLVEPNGLTARFDRLLLQSASVHYREDLPAGRNLLRAVTGTVTDVYGAVEVLDSPPVTLTAVEGQVPVTVRSTAEIPLRVLITLRSPRFEVEGGATRELVLEPSTTEILTFQVRALTPGGTSPVQVVVSDLDGVLDLATGTVVVRSTAFSVAAVAITAGAGAFLLLWWARGRAARRQRTPTPEPRGTRREAERVPASKGRP